MKSLITMSALIFWIGQGSATQTSATHLKSDRLISVPISCGGLLRVAVKGDLIQDVVIYPEKLSDRMTLHKSGQFFLDTKGLSQPVTITIMTQRNITQDMKLYCDSKCESGPLILEQEEKPKSELSVEDPKLSRLIKKALRGELERGTSLPRKSNRTREDVVWKGKKYWEVDGQIIERYEAENDTSKVIILRPEILQEKDDLAISFDRDFLEPNQKAVMVVVRTKETAS